MKGLIAFALGFLTAVGAAQVTKIPAGYLLRVRYLKGMVVRSTMTNSLLGLSGTGGAPVKFSIPVTIRVLDVNGRKAKIEISTGAVHLGKTVLPAQRAVATINDLNQASGGSAGVPGAAQLPMKAIRPGETWTAMTPISTGMGTSMLKAVYKFQGIRLTGGPPVAIVTYTMSGTTEGAGTETLLVKDGTVYSNVSDLKLGGFKVHSTLTRD